MAAMCGVTGIAIPSRLRRPVDGSMIHRMNCALEHRGPDDAGIHLDGNVGLGNRRLSIIDLAGGHQPMCSDDGSLAVSYNGEIYNASHIRQMLEHRGHHYRTSCDTEAILHLHRAHGIDAVRHLRGCFAFALWDRDRRELLLVRDRLGVKPLYYVLDADGTLSFASEMKALLTGPHRPALNADALPEYLAHRATYGAETMFEGVRRLLPGHLLRWRDGPITIEQYWDIDHDGDQGPVDRMSGTNDAERIERWQDSFREAVELRLVADVPVGVFLSGGIDSSAIAAVTSELTHEPIKTFSVGFAEKEANELASSRAFSRTIGSDHREVIVSSDQFFAALPRLAWHADEPLGHSACVPLYAVAQLASRHVKVILSGEGADETLAGYNRYRMALYNLALGRMYERIAPEPFRVALRNGASASASTSAAGRRLSRTFLRQPADVEHLYFEEIAVFDRVRQARLLTAGLDEQLTRHDPHHEARQHFDRSVGNGLLDRMLYTDGKTYLPALLMKQDTMSMAASLEARVPYLDHLLVDRTSRLPRRLKLSRWWTTKYVLRESMRTTLPTTITTRPKQGFPVPIGRWFREAHRDVVDDHLLGERARARGLFEPEAVRDLICEHQAGVDHGERLWSLVAFEQWARCFLDGDGPGATVPEFGGLR